MLHSILSIKKSVYISTDVFKYINRQYTLKAHKTLDTYSEQELRKKSRLARGPVTPQKRRNTVDS